MGARFEARSTVACPVCKRQRPLSVRFANLHTLVLWLKNLEIVSEGDTSITWLTEVRKLGQASKDAFGAWPDGNTSTVTVVGVLLGTGKGS